MSTKSASPSYKATIELMGRQANTSASSAFSMIHIRENYFNQYNVDTPNDRQAIVWEHKQAKALFNILADNLENIFKTIENTNNDLKEF